MDPGLVARVSNPFENGIAQKIHPMPQVDADAEPIIAARNFSYNTAEGAFDNENISVGQNGVGIDSESTYSCPNSSSDERNVDSDSVHEFTSQNGMPIDSSNNGQCMHNNDDKNVSQIPETPSSASPISVQGIKDESSEYIRPEVGVEFESEDHAYKCYNKYALMEGFSIRKDFVNRSKVTGLVVSRRYTCHRQGYGSNKREVNMNKPRKETRTGCLAHMTITRQTNGKYRVIHFETRHNHEFVTPFTAHLLPSQKRISFVEAVEAESAASPFPDGVPKLGMGFDSENHAYEFYNAYAGRLGFSVRKDYINRSKKDGSVASRRYTCYREGYRQKDKRGLKVKRPRKETRVGCMAQLVISRQTDGRYRVTHFEEHHNHELVTPCKARTLRSQKKPTTALSMESSSIMPPRSLAELLLTQVQDDFIYDPIDHDTLLTSKRMDNIKQEEAECIHHYFQSKKLKEPSLFYTVQLDVEEEMTNFFWADEKMLADYGDFGDVVCFNTITRLNKGLRPLILFHGVNNHKQVLVFAAALLYDDTAPSFKWLFQTFLKAMSGKVPKTILSDRDDAISEAIVSELPRTQHKLCTWQIYQNALKYLGQVIVSSDSLSNDLCGCIFNLDEDDFVSSWKIMLHSYGLWENKWLHSVFEEREKWALPYTKHIFLADIEIALLSDDLITGLKKYLKLESHVLQLLKYFGRLMNDLRYKELEANYDMEHHTPRLIGDVIMLKQVMEVYTPVIFKMFQEEYENYLNIVVNQYIDNASSAEYKVSTYGQVREHTVIYRLEDDSVSCSCMKFRSVGILCSHALKVLDYRNIKIVPSQYILKRWTRDARA